MVDRKIIIRADFYPSGEIIPLGITNSLGDSWYIDKIIKIEKRGLNEISYICLCSNKQIILTYKNGVWECE